MLFFSDRTKRESPAATSAENLVASAQFLVALATSESQFRTLGNATSINVSVQMSLVHIHVDLFNNYSMSARWI